MGFPVYDYRKDIRNLLVTPQIRSRFLRLEGGQVAKPHTHDLGHEVFLMLQGRAIFEIDGEKEELGPGQMCVALVNQMHGIQVVSNEPVIMYLSVTPHIQPTHTMWTEDGRRLPHRFVPSKAYDVETDASTPIDQLLDRFVAAAQGVAEAAQGSARTQRQLAATLKKALARGDQDAATTARSAMWEALFRTYEKVYSLADIWNDLAPRAGKVDSG
jgi:quercetin dioxygenase-like cupin family protein